MGGFISDSLLKLDLVKLGLVSIHIRKGSKVTSMAPLGPRVWAKSDSDFRQVVTEIIASARAARLHDMSQITLFVPLCEAVAGPRINYVSFCLVVFFGSE